MNPISRETISNLLTRDNITLALSILGSIGTVFTLLNTILNNRKRINMRIIGHIWGDTKMLILYASFENKSRLPISLTQISLKIDGAYYPCVEPPIIAYEETIKTNNVITSHHEYMTMNLPINLGALSGSSGYMCFEFPPNIYLPESTHLTFSINSNRGKVFEKTLSLGPQLD